jgi:hypothetical protein
VIFADIVTGPLAAAFLLLDSNDSDLAAAAPLLLCLSGFIYFGIMYARYRNSDKRHHHEAETPATIRDLQRYDQFSQHLRRLRNSQMQDRNDSQVDGALNVGGGLAEKLADAKNLLGQ